MMPIADIQRVYAAIGDAGFRALVEAFYRRVEADPVLRPIFPPDLAGGRERQYIFLRQYFGGPPEYTERYGHPQLRSRHLPFAITRAARDVWVRHMHAAIDETGIPEPHAAIMHDYFERFSLEMINRGDEASRGTGLHAPENLKRPARVIETIDP